MLICDGLEHCIFFGVLLTLRNSLLGTALCGVCSSGMPISCRGMHYILAQAMECCWHGLEHCIYFVCC